MKKTKPKKKPDSTKNSTKAGIPASKILRAEAARLDVLVDVMGEMAGRRLTATAWGFNLAAAYLDSLGAPERLIRYVPAPEPKEHP